LEVLRDKVLIIKSLRESLAMALAVAQARTAAKMDADNAYLQEVGR
jgi:hypothetical protein